MKVCRARLRLLIFTWAQWHVQAHFLDRQNEIAGTISHSLTQLIWHLEAINIAPVAEICSAYTLSLTPLQPQRQVRRLIKVKGNWSSGLGEDIQYMSVFGFIFTKVLNASLHAAREQVRVAGKIGRCYFAFEVRTYEFLDTAVLIDDPTYAAVEHRELFIRFSKLDVLLVSAVSHSPFFEQPAQAASFYSTANIDVLDSPKSL